MLYGWEKGLRTYHRKNHQVMALELYKGCVCLQATGKQHRDGTQPRFKEPDDVTVVQLSSWDWLAFLLLPARRC